MLNKKESDKIVVIPNGISLPGNENLNQQEENGIKIGIVGSISRLKGIHLVIEALKDILKTNNISLHIFGTTSYDKDSLDYKTELNELIKKLSLDEKVYFEGYRENKEKIYMSLKIVVNYSMVPEAFSFTVVEAMSFRKIVIAANSGGPKEIINDNETGFLVEPQNVTLLREQILFCIKNINTTDFEMIRENAFNRVKEKYSIQSFSSDYINLFNSLMDS